MTDRRIKERRKQRFGRWLNNRRTLPDRRVAPRETSNQYVVTEWYARALPGSPIKALSVAQLREISALVTSIDLAAAPALPQETPADALEWLRAYHGDTIDALPPQTISIGLLCEYLAAFANRPAPAAPEKGKVDAEISKEASSH